MAALSTARWRLVATVAAAALFAGCASGPPGSRAAPDTAPASASSSAAPLAHYHCDHDISFTVRFDDDSALIDAGPWGVHTLLRDAGGVTPQQTVYSSGTMKAEFGLGADGRQAMLSFVSPPLQARCVRKP